MKNIHVILLVLFSLIGASVLNSQQEITLSTSPQLVIPSAERAVVLSVAYQVIDDKESSFLATLADVENPLGTEPIMIAVVEEKVEAVVVYDDASVLKVIAANFAKQVRGTLARNGSSFIQLQGGRLMNAGSSFPARIPEAADKTYTVEVTEVNPEGYTLRLGDATQSLTYSEPANSGSNSVSKNPQSPVN